MRIDLPTSPCFQDICSRSPSHRDHIAAIGLDEFHQLLCLLCPDFPFTLVQNAARIDLHWTADPAHVPFGAFADKWALLFFYSEFMNLSAQAFKQLDTADTGKVPRHAYLSALLALVSAKRLEFVCPDTTLLFRVLAPHAGGAISDEIMFNEFCVHLFSASNGSVALPLRMLEFPLLSPVADEFAQRTFAEQSAAAAAATTSSPNARTGAAGGSNNSTQLQSPFTERLAALALKAPSPVPQGARTSSSFGSGGVGGGFR